ncbi:hypothetical protein V1389_13865 [Flavobacterium rakeshii]|uniref:hypothetical protein n=1 Tax=Flavobacterium rakeshii TaxID=1038845 RepID=UPI002E7B0E72|nr:hypothetical protein [Flavobacterium rakeshii]MEE1899431.1 hypothetical protein [Flavobacterium rakeshii]
MKIYKHTFLYITFLLLSVSGFAQNSNLYKAWLPTGKHGDVYTYEAINDIGAYPNAFIFDKSGTLLEKYKGANCGTSKVRGTDKDVNTTPKTQVLGKWRWLKPSVIEVETKERGTLIRKKYKISKVDDTSLILIDLH